MILNVSSGLLPVLFSGVNVELDLNEIWEKKFGTIL